MNPFTVLRDVWLAGVAALSIFLMIGYSRLAILRKRTRTIHAGPLVTTIYRATVEFGVALPEIRAGDCIATPFVSGVLHPTLYVPENWVTARKSEAIEAVCRHELAHLASFDLSWNLVYRLIAIGLWPHPLLWSLIRTATIASEEACDRKVLSSGCSPERYATCLLDLKENPGVSRDVALVGLGAVSIRSSFGKRIEAIMDYSVGIRKELSRSTIMALIIGCGLVAAMTASGIASPSLQEDHAQSGSTDRSKTTFNLKHVSLGLLMYANDYDDVFPYVQSTKAVQYVTFPYIHGSKQWVNDLTVKAAGHLEPIDVSESWKTHNPNGGEIRFNMGIAGVTTTSLEQPAMDAMVYESKAWPDGGRVVGFCDGHVKVVGAATWESLSKNLTPKGAYRSAKPLPLNYGANFDINKPFDTTKTTPAMHG